MREKCKKLSQRLKDGQIEATSPIFKYYLT